MKNLRLVVTLFMFSVLSGCASNYSLQKSSLAVDDGIDVISAKVDNPYPECDSTKESTRVANLSVERSERVYLQGGKLCQRSN